MYLRLVVVGFLLDFTPLQGYNHLDGPPIFLDHSVEPGTSGCVDLDKKCSVWASQGECQSNAAWMMGNCRRSCQSCQGGDKAWKLRNMISGSYDNSSVEKNFSINYVFMESVRIDHVEVDEERQMMTIHGKMVLTWNDTRLKWDREKYGLSWLNFYWVQIWTPEIVQSNSPNGTPAKIKGKVLAANYTGQAYMWSDFTFTSTCSFDYGSFPADKQQCCFKLDDKRYYAVRILVKDSAKMLAKQSAKKSHSSGWVVEGADIVQNQYRLKILSDWTLDPFDVEMTNCDICIKVSRSKAYFSSEIVAPAAALAVVVLSSFLVGSFWNQILLLLCSLGLEFLSLFMLNARLPPSSGSAPGIVKFHCFNLVMIMMLLVLSILLMNLANLRSVLPPPSFLDRLVKLFERFLPCCKVDQDDLKFGDPTINQNEIDHQSHKSAEKCHWLPVARALKYVLFLIALVLYVIVMFAYFNL